MEITITKGQKTVVNDDIYPLLNKLKWQAQYDGKRFYVVRNGGERLHHYVVGKPFKGYCVDHINGNTLDNRRENLRVTTYRENRFNSEAMRSGLVKSRFIGVSYHANTTSKNWQAQTRKNGKKISLGYFSTEREASQAYLKFIEEV